MEVEMKIRGLMMDPVTNMPIVILKDVGGDAVLQDREAQRLGCVGRRCGLPCQRPLWSG